MTIDEEYKKKDLVLFCKGLERDIEAVENAVAEITLWYTCLEKLLQPEGRK